jgi:hypothetical protein
MTEANLVSGPAGVERHVAPTLSRTPIPVGGARSAVGRVSSTGAEPVGVQR